MDAGAWFEGEPDVTRALASEMIAFEADDDVARVHANPHDRFAGEWALVTHQMTALGLAQLSLEHPEWRAEYAPLVTRAALKSSERQMRDFGTRAWGHDGLSVLEGGEGHAYLAYAALAVSMARRIDPAFPKDAARAHDALIASLERRLLASSTAIIETYPGQAFPTDVAAVAAAIGRARARYGREITRGCSLIWGEECSSRSDRCGEWVRVPTHEREWARHRWAEGARARGSLRIMRGS